MLIIVFIGWWSSPLAKQSFLCSYPRVQQCSRHSWRNRFQLLSLCRSPSYHCRPSHRETLFSQGHFSCRWRRSHKTLSHLCKCTSLLHWICCSKSFLGIFYCLSNSSYLIPAWFHPPTLPRRYSPWLYTGRIHFSFLSQTLLRICLHWRTLLYRVRWEDRFPILPRESLLGV